MVFGGYLPVLTVTYKGLLGSDKGEDLLSHVFGIATKATSASDVGEYCIFFTKTDGISAVNYNIVFVQGALTVVQAVPEYPLPQPGVVVYSIGLKYKHIKLPDGWAWDIPNNYVGDAGNKSASATFTPEDTHNFKVITLNISFTLVRASVYKPTWGNIEFIFNGFERSPVIYNWDESLVRTMDGSTEKATAVGQYFITFELIDKINYQWNDGTNVNIVMQWEIGFDIIAMPTLNKSFEYTSYLIKITSDDILGFASTEFEIAKGLSTMKAVDVDRYKITISLHDKNNKRWTDGTADDLELYWSITPALLTVIADNKTRDYGVQNPEFTYKVLGLLGEDNTKVITVGFKLETIANEKSPVTSAGYVIYFDGTAEARNYEFSFISGVLMINRAVVEFPTIDSAIFVYNTQSQHPAVTWNDDLVEKLFASIDTVNVGTYEIEFRLRDNINYEWLGGSVNNYFINWDIIRASGVIKLPEVYAEFPYPQYGTVISQWILADGWVWVNPLEIPTVINDGYFAELDVSTLDRNYDWSVIDGYDALLNKIIVLVDVPVTRAAFVINDFEVLGDVKPGDKVFHLSIMGGWNWLEGDTILVEGANEITVYIDVSELVDNFDFSGIEGFDTETLTISRVIVINVPKRIDTHDSIRVYLVLGIMIFIVFFVLYKRILKLNFNRGVKF